MIQLSPRDDMEGRIGQDTCLPASPGNGKDPPEAVLRQTLDQRLRFGDRGHFESRRGSSQICDRLGFLTSLS